MHTALSLALHRVAESSSQRTLIQPQTSLTPLQRDTNQEILPNLVVLEPHRSGSHLAKAACSSSSFLASCILSSAICACSSAIWSCRSLESPSSFRRVFSNSCLCFSSRRRRSEGEGDTFSYMNDTLQEHCTHRESKATWATASFLPIQLSSALFCQELYMQPPLYLALKTYLQFSFPSSSKPPSPLSL